jgi:fibronectin type 3 domain-containing protein
MAAFAAPSAPNDLAANSGNAQATLSWSAVTGATHYKIYRRTSPSGTFVNVATTAQTSIVNPGLTNGTTYYYVVRASDNTGDSGNSNEVNVIPYGPPPTNLIATPGNASVALTWNAPSGATSHKVFRATAIGGPYTLVQNNNGDEDWSDTTSTGLVNNTTYYYVVNAVRGSDQSANSNEALATPRPAPSAPTGLSATAGNGQVSLTWNSVTHATSYVVRRKPASGSYSTIATVPTNSYVDTTPTNGVTYTYIIRAVSAGGESSDSGTATATPRVTAPQNFTATPAHQSVTLTWDVVPGATAYKVKRGTSSGTYTSTQNVSGATTNSYTWTGLTNGATYYFVVLATDSAGDGPNSAQASATPYPLPGAPTGLVVTPGNAQNGLNWNAVSGATGYFVQRKLSGASYSFSTTVATNNYVDTGLTNGTQYIYRIAAITGAGTGSNSSEVGGTPKLDAPTGISATPGSAQVTISWNAVPNANGYRVKRGTTSGSYSSTQNVSGGTTTSYTWTGLTNGTTYYFVVDATAPQSAGNSVNSAQVSAVPALGIPINLVATPGNAQVSLTWTAVAGASSYQVWRSTTSGSGYTQVGTPSGASFNNGSLTNGTMYYYVVRAVSGGTVTANSNEASARPVAMMPTPLNLSATPGNQSVSLTWDAVPGATNYKIKRGTSSGSYSSTQTISATSTSYTWSSLTNGTTYYFVVTATGNSTESANSNEVNAKPTAAPTVPTGLSTISGDGSIYLSWTAVSGANSYNIKRSLTPGGPYTVVGTSGTNSHTDLGLTNGITYYYVVSAVGYGGESANSSEVSATPVPPAPDGPAAPTYSELTGTSVKVTATALPLYAAELFLQMKLTGQGDEAYVLVEDGIGGGQSTIVHGLDPGTQYTFRYVARNVSGLTPGTSASVTMPQRTIAWNAGTPISCGGIYFPEGTATLAANAQGRVSAYLATDWDGREVTLDSVTTSATFSDPCSYTWSFSGGSALNGITTGQNFIWVAPAVPGTYTITLTVDDQNNGNKPGGETGTRNDAQQGVDEDPISFTVTVTVT